MVIIREVITQPDGTVGLGNSYEVEIPDAIAKIKSGEFKAETAAIGVIPSEWAAVEVKNGQRDNK